MDRRPSSPASDSLASPGAIAIALSLAGQCRLAGLAVPTSATLAFSEALALLGPRGLSDLYWAGRATLVRRPEDLPIYDDAYATLLAASVGAPVHPPPAAPTLTLVADLDGERSSAEPDAVDGGDEQQVRYSATEVLRTVDFAELADDTLDPMLRTLTVRRSLRTSRRRRPDHHGHGPIDVARTARRSLRTGGETMHRVVRTRRATPRRLVLLLDVSGSMEPYARALLRFAHLARAGETRVEVFALGTRLTRLTRALGERDCQAALVAAGAEIDDWAGGTRLGASLQRFNDEWGVAGMARGATVVILSDGWDRGEPTLLGDEMARLHRVAHRVVWVNPLKATADYAPLAGGMAAALPHVDHFVSGHSIAALEELVEVMAE
jgi:uncharacterized protein with von Willebrand factor type A (vWA) domain